MKKQAVFRYLEGIRSMKIAGIFVKNVNMENVNVDGKDYKRSGEEKDRGSAINYM